MVNLENLLKNEEEFVSLMLQRTSLVFSEDKIHKVRNSVVGLCGFGGVGAICAELIARWGVKKIRLFDKDFYEPTNLNRQLFATTKTLGRPKTQVAAERIKEIYPFVDIESIVQDRVSNDNVYEFVDGLDVLIQTTDSPSSLLFYKAAELKKIPLVNGYASVIGGFVTVFDFRDRIKRSIWERLKDFLKWRGRKDITKMTREELDELDEKWGIGTAPSINFITNMVGCFIVAETIKLLTGYGKVVKYPYRISFNVFEPSLKIERSGSFREYFQFRKIKKFIRK